MLPGVITSDSDLVAELLANEIARQRDERSDDRALERALMDVLPQLQGAFSFVLADEGHVVAPIARQLVETVMTPQCRHRHLVGVSSWGSCNSRETGTGK